MTFSDFGFSRETVINTQNFITVSFLCKIIRGIILLWQIIAAQHNELVNILPKKFKSHQQFFYLPFPKRILVLIFIVFAVFPIYKFLLFGVNSTTINVTNGFIFGSLGDFLLSNKK